VAPSAAAALQDAGALVLGDHTLHLQQQIVLGRAADGAVEERDLDTGSAELLDQQYLVGVAARQAIRSMHVDPVDLAGHDRVAQALQGRARERRAATTFVHVGMVRIDRGTLGGCTLPQGRELARHRVAARLAVARHPCIQRGRDPTHVQPSANRLGPRRPVARAELRDALPAASGGVGSAPGARRPRPGTAARSASPRTRPASPVRQACCAGPWALPSARPLLPRSWPVSRPVRNRSPYCARRPARATSVRHSKLATLWGELSRARRGRYPPHPPGA
jgi:hypothetical protein